MNKILFVSKINSQDSEKLLCGLENGEKKNEEH